MSDGKWGIRGVLDNASRHRTEPVDVRVAHREPEPEGLDPEAGAIHAIVAAIKTLDTEARQRVLTYIALRFPPHKFED